MAVPDFQTLMLPVLESCRNREQRVRDIVESLSGQFGLSAEQQTEKIPSGLTSRFHNRVGWAKTYLKQAGLLTKPQRGVVAITERGRRLLDTKPLRIDMPLLEQYPEYREFKTRSRATAEAPDSQSVLLPVTLDSTPEEQIDAASGELAASLRSDLLARTLSAPPSFFEGLVIDLMLAMGYGGSREDAAERLGRSGDGGVDGVIREDRLGLDRIYLQAKRYQPANRVGRPAVQEFIGALHGNGAQKGVFITTSDFTLEARAYVGNLGAIRVVLIEGETLAALMIKHGVGVRSYRMIDIKRVDADYFEDSISDSG